MDSGLDCGLSTERVLDLLIHTRDSLQVYRYTFIASPVYFTQNRQAVTVWVHLYVTLLNQKSKYIWLSSQLL